MTEAARALTPEPEDHDHVVVLRNATWADFQRRSRPERPDLAIEVVRTSGGLNKLEIYRKLRVREVWCWRKGKLELYTLRRDQYLPITKSKVLPGIDHRQIAELLSVRPMTKAVRAYRKALRAR